jgi:hypothetical protein
MNSSFAFLRRRLPGVALLLLAAQAGAAVWQWSTPVNNGRAFLWIPPDCKQVRAVVVGQNNMIEEGILEHAIMRKELTKLGIAEIFIAPPFENWQNATNNDAANAKFDALMKSLAEVSGYSELKVAPIVPLAHSAMASYPWNFAAWNPSRTLAILSVHGDAPQTDRVGNGKPNVDWGGRNIDGIPGLMVMGEYEWSDDRLTPALKFRAEHPKAAIAMLAELGNGHFNFCDDLIKFLAMFIRKSAEARLPAEFFADKPPVLKLVNPTKGWLVERWHLNQPRMVKPAAFAKYAGDLHEAFWCFDKEMALATQNYYSDQPVKLPQLLGFVQDGKIVPQTDSLEQVRLKFEPQADGVTFNLSPTFLNSVETGSKNLSRWSCLPAGSLLGHATGGGPIVVHKIIGPVEQAGANTFVVSLNRLNSTTDWRGSDIWLWASHPGDAKYKNIVQQALIKVPSFNEGAEQHITFPKISDQKAGTKALKLGAKSDSGREVHYYVREGPAEISGDELQFTKIPPRSKFPVEVTVVAWQLGRGGDPKLKTAAPVEHMFEINK